LEAAAPSPSGSKGKRPAAPQAIAESYHEQPHLVKDRDGNLRRCKLSDAVVQLPPAEQSGPSSSTSAASQAVVVFELVESSKMDILRGWVTDSLFGSHAAAQPCPAPPPPPPPPAPPAPAAASVEPECLNTTEQLKQARRGLVTTLMEQGSAKVLEVKEEVVEQQDNNQFAAQFIDRQQKDIDSLKAYITKNGLPLPKL
jgi:hypothetical protein